MRNGTKGCIAGALKALGCIGVAIPAEQSGNPYQTIVDRNVFGLRPPPPLTPPEPDRPPPRKITLEGITTWLGMKFVLMKVQVHGSNPGAKTEEVPLTLTVGQKQEDVAVLDIHKEEPKWVKVNNSGTLMDLNFKDNGVNLIAAASTQPPGVPPRPTMPIPLPTTKSQHWPAETTLSAGETAIHEAAYVLKHQKNIQQDGWPVAPGMENNPFLQNLTPTK